MLSTVTRALPRLSQVSSRTVNISRRSMLTFTDKMSKKEKVEEDRFMRAQEEAWKEKLRVLRAQEEAEREEAFYNDVINPVKAYVAKELAATGDKVSDKGLETLAKWKLDL